MKFYKITILFIFISFKLSAQHPTGAAEEENLGLVKWTTLEEAEKLCKDKPRPIMIDFYTDWCGWCKVMMKNTFSNPGIAEYINTFFYPVRFNAETKDTLIYKGKKYANNGTGQRPTHSLAIEMLKGQLSYPTIGYIDETGAISPVAGYLAPNDIEPILVFFAEKVNKYAPYDDFKKYFKYSFSKDTVINDLVTTHSFPEAVELAKKNPRKILFNITSKWNNSCKIMSKTTYNHPVIAKYINEHYYIVNLVAESTDTIKVFDQIFINEQLAPNYPHQVVITMMNKQIFYPSLLVMNEQFQMMDKIQGYFTPEALEPILQFLSEDKFKTIKYDEFLKTFTPVIKRNR